MTCASWRLDLRATHALKFLPSTPPVIPVCDLFSSNSVAPSEVTNLVKPKEAGNIKLVALDRAHCKRSIAAAPANILLLALHLPLLVALRGRSGGCAAHLVLLALSRRRSCAVNVVAASQTGMTRKKNEESK